MPSSVNPGERAFHRTLSTRKDWHRAAVGMLHTGTPTPGAGTGGGGTGSGGHRCGCSGLGSWGSRPLLSLAHSSPWGQVLHPQASGRGSSCEGVRDPPQGEAEYVLGPPQPSAFPTATPWGRRGRAQPLSEVISAVSSPSSYDSESIAWPQRVCH